MASKEAPINLHYNGKEVCCAIFTDEALSAACSLRLIHALMVHSHASWQWSTLCKLMKLLMKGYGVIYNFSVF